jgi:hypothetical protein
MYLSRFFRPSLGTPAATRSFGYSEIVAGATNRLPPTVRTLVAHPAEFDYARIQKRGRTGGMDMLATGVLRRLHILDSAVQQSPLNVPCAIESGAAENVRILPHISPYSIICYMPLVLLDASPL